jgi:2-polyprenyl-6-methoxyphenol hydroxylase-like FAD-dependent oxidoreductase
MLMARQYGYDLTGITYGEDGKDITATFANGESVQGTLIIGCDGPRSKVRETLLGHEKGDVTPMEIVHSNVAIVYHDAEKAKFVRSAHPVFSLMVHPSLLTFIASLYPPLDYRYQY